MRCWSCGTDIPGGLRHIITCPTCATLEEQRNIRYMLESTRAQSIPDAIKLMGLEELTEGLSEIASILEWGLEEIRWELEQVRGVLENIYETLKSPTTTQANEWRLMAEELRRRGVLDKSQSLFLKALEANPLDYRTYIGLGKTCLQMGELDQARAHWDASLPHAPKLGIDYKSYSYRLIGRTYFCEGDYPQAALTLKTSIELSPHYIFAHYDHAQYTALASDKEKSLTSLVFAILEESSLYQLAKMERNLEPVFAVESCRHFIEKLHRQYHGYSPLSMLDREESFLVSDNFLRKVLLNLKELYKLSGYFLSKGREGAQNQPG